VLTSEEEENTSSERERELYHIKNARNLSYVILMELYIQNFNNTTASKEEEETKSKNKVEFKFN
jgi:hypothetical protein